MKFTRVEACSTVRTPGHGWMALILLAAATCACRSTITNGPEDDEGGPAAALDAGKAGGSGGIGGRGGGAPGGSQGGTSAMAGAQDCGPQQVPRQGLMVWLRASAGVETNGQGGIVSWKDQATGKAATLQARPAAFYDDQEDAAAPTAPRLAPTAANGKPAVRFNGEHDELTIVDPPCMAGVTSLTIAEVAATTKLVKPNADWCQEGLKDPIIENGCSGTYRATFFWPFPGVGYSAISLSLMQESVAVQYGTGTRDQKFFWMRPQPIGSKFSRAIAMHDGSKNHLWVNGERVATTDAQDGKVEVLNDGERLDVGVGRFDTHWPGDLAELLIYNRALTEGERSALDAYFACTYF